MMRDSKLGEKKRLPIFLTVNWWIWFLPTLLTKFALSLLLLITLTLLEKCGYPDESQLLHLLWENDTSDWKSTSALTPEALQPLNLYAAVYVWWNNHHIGSRKQRQKPRRGTHPSQLLTPVKLTPRLKRKKQLRKRRVIVPSHLICHCCVQFCLYYYVHQLCIWLTFQ
jgi:hypothetical protein